MFVKDALRSLAQMFSQWELKTPVLLVPYIQELLVWQIYKLVW
jgi:hypothetical protein